MSRAPPPTLISGHTRVLGPTRGSFCCRSTRSSGVYSSSRAWMLRISGRLDFSGSPKNQN